MAFAVLADLAVAGCAAAVVGTAAAVVAAGTAVVVAAEFVIGKKEVHRSTFNEL